ERQSLRIPLFKRLSNPPHNPQWNQFAMSFEKHNVPGFSLRCFDEKVCQFRLEFRMQVEFGLLDDNCPSRSIQSGDDNGHDLRDADAHIVGTEFDRTVNWDDQDAGLSRHVVQIEPDTDVSFVEGSAREQLDDERIGQVEFLKALEPEPVAGV